MYLRNTIYAQLLLFPLICVVIIDAQSPLYVDVGKNLTITCPLEHKNGVMWEHDTSDMSQQPHFITLEDGSLLLHAVTRNDSGIYACHPENSSLKSKIQVYVKSPPPALPNVIVHPSTILAYIIWQVNETGGYPIIHFTAEYRLINESEWRLISPYHISPNLRRLEVYKLEPSTTYAFRIWAVNQLGKGEITEVVQTTLHNYTETELAGRLLDGARTFDTRVWIVAVAVVMGTLTILGVGTCFLLYQECRIPGAIEDHEVIELVPNIILNPGFEGTLSSTPMPADENCNNETPVRLNNNIIVQPRNC